MKSKQQNRRSLYFAAVATLLLLPSVGLAEAEDPELDPMIPVGFLIIRSTPNYAEALRVAERAASQVDIPLDLRGLVYDPAHGLTWPAEVCEKDPLYPFPCYVARGRFDPGVYLSVERSDAYAAGVRQYDIIVSFNGVTIEDPSHFMRMLSDAQIGSTVTLGLLRNGRQLTAKVPIAQTSGTRTRRR